MNVQMRGFTRRSTVAQVTDWVDRHAAAPPSEPVPLMQAAGRVLAESVHSRYDVPGFDRSMMDGFAVRADDVAGASTYSPIPLQVIGEALPGRPFRGSLQAGQAVRIMTGAPRPSGADAVVPVEHVEQSASTNRGAPTQPAKHIEVQQPLPIGKNIGRRGEDIAAGQQVLAQGRRLRPQDLGVLSSIGMASIPVVRQPRVVLLITGNEILPPGSALEEHRIVDANSPMLQALAVRDGGVVTACQRVEDDPAAIGRAMQTPADIVLISGGSSVGQEDHAPRLLAELGELAHHGVAMRPSSPAGVGRLGGALVFLLPGNPVSCLCAYDFFAGRAVRQLAGLPAAWPYPLVRRPLARKVSSVVGRVDYARVRLVRAPEDAGNEEEPPTRVVPLAISGASMLSSTTRADGFLVLPQDSEGFAAGENVDVYLYDTTPAKDPLL